MQPDLTKGIVVVGGPNGAGKTSWAAKHLPTTLNIREFVNADEIARGLSPFDPDSSIVAAGRVMLDRLDMLAKVGDNFAFETTCASHRHPRFLKSCRALGYQFMLVFLWLPSAEVAVARVARRVRQGGHRIPDEVVVRRYSAGLRNMRHLYLPLADSAFIYDNSDGGGALIAERQGAAPLTIHDSNRWSRIEEATR
jgi:predicted ABC-type ATPase